MYSFKTLLVFLFTTCVIAQDSLLEPCSKHDIDCLSKSTELFLEKTCKGIPQYDIRPIDPLLIPEVDVLANEDMGLIFHFRNLNVTGLKNQKISDFQMDTTSKSVLLKTKADLNIVADVLIELSKQTKTFPGTITFQASIIGAAQYNYDLKKDSNGVQHFEVGPEKFTCEAIGEPAVFLSPELAETIAKDRDAKAYAPSYQAHRVAIRQRMLCKIVELCYVDVVHNIRASAKVLPASAYFTDVN